MILFINYLLSFLSSICCRQDGIEGDAGETWGGDQEETGRNRRNNEKGTRTYIESLG